MLVFNVESELATNCQATNEVELMFAGKPRALADQNSFLNLLEQREKKKTIRHLQKFTNNKRHFYIWNLKCYRRGFYPTKILSFDRHIFSVTDRRQSQTVELLSWKTNRVNRKLRPRKQREERPIRDVFFGNLIHPDFQKKFLKETIEPRKTLGMSIK